MHCAGDERKLLLCQYRLTISIRSLTLAVKGRVCSLGRLVERDLMIIEMIDLSYEVLHRGNGVS